MFLRTPPMEPHSVVANWPAEAPKAPESTTAQLRGRVARIGLEGESRGARFHLHDEPCSLSKGLKHTTSTRHGQKHRHTAGTRHGRARHARHGRARRARHGRARRARHGRARRARHGRARLARHGRARRARHRHTAGTASTRHGHRGELLSSSIAFGLPPRQLQLPPLTW